MHEHTSPRPPRRSARRKLTTVGLFQVLSLQPHGEASSTKEPSLLNMDKLSHPLSGHLKTFAPGRRQREAGLAIGCSQLPKTLLPATETESLAPGRPGGARYSSTVTFNAVVWWEVRGMLGEMKDSGKQNRGWGKRESRATGRRTVLFATIITGWALPCG